MNINEILEELQKVDLQVLYERKKPHPYFYRKYLEFLNTGKYPYLDAVRDFTIGFLPGLNEIQRKNLKSQIYYCSDVYRDKQKERKLKSLYKLGWLPAEQIKNLENNTKIELYREVESIMGDITKKSIYKVFSNNTDTFLMKPKATKTGISLGSLINNSEIAIFKVA